MDLVQVAFLSCCEGKIVVELKIPAGSWSIGNVQLLRKTQRGRQKGINPTACSS